MKNALWISCLILAAMATGCSKDDSESDNNGSNGEPQSPAQTITFDAKLENTAFKTDWEENDKVKIFAQDGSAAELAISGQSGNYTIAGELPQSDVYYAIYPAAAEASLSESKLLFSIPAGQQALANNLAENGCFLAAKSEGGNNSLTFKNITGFISFSIPEGSDAIARITVKTNDQSALVGDCAVAIANNIPSLTLGAETGDELTVTPLQEGTFAAGTYSLAVIPGTKKGGLTLSAYDADGNLLYTKPTQSNLSMNTGVVTDLGEIIIPNGDFQVVGQPTGICSMSDIGWQLSVTPEDAQITWTSSDEKVATVDQTGKVSFTGHGTVTIYASDGKETVETVFSIPAGFYRDLFTDDEETALWSLNPSHVSSGAKESLVSMANGEWCLNVIPYVKSNTGRGDIMRNQDTYLSRTYPILCFRVDDVNDKKINVEGNEIAPSRYINIDTDTEDQTYRGDLGGSNNKWWKKYKCSDGSAILVYNLDEQNFGKTANQLPEDGTPFLFTKFQIKYADINRDQTVPSLQPEDITYRMFWFYSFTSEPEMNDFLSDWSSKSGVSYE